MTYKLAALHLRSVGERSARFQEQTLTFTAPADGGSEPQDSVIWLRNGGGKSSILSLLYALLLPRSTDFMGRSVKRSLTDYIDGGDTAHVVALWEPAGTSRTLLGEADGALVTGAVHEWADLRRPANPEESKDRLTTLFYAFRVVPGALDLATLPFADDMGHLLRLTEYQEALREQARPFGVRASLAVTGKQHEWRRALDDRHLDPEVFRSQKQMNHVEGGVEDLFRFSSAFEFIDFLLDLTVSPDSVNGVAARLGQVSRQLAAKPAKQDEQRFCTMAATNLDSVAAMFAEAAKAEETAEAAAQDAARLAASFQATTAAMESEQDRLAEEEEVARRAATAATNERNQANDLLYLYRREAARLRLAEAEAAEAEAASAASRGAAEARAWETVPGLARLSLLRADLDRTRAEADAEEADLAPLRAEHARHAARLRRRLEQFALTADEDAAAAGASRQSAIETAAAEKENAARAREEERAAGSAAAEVRTRLDILDGRRRRGTELGHLPSPATPPAEHRETVREAREGHLAALAELESQRERRRGERSSLQDRAKQLVTEWNTADQSLNSAAAARQSLGVRLDGLRGSPRVRELAEAAADETVALWSESAVLLRRLSDAVLGADDERIRRRAERHADERAIAEHDRSQFLPPSLDASQVCVALAAVTAAQAGWEYLRGAVPAGELLSLLDTPAIARVGSGVVIPAAASAGAVAYLEGNDIRTTSLVSVYTAAEADALIVAARSGSPTEAAPTWTGLQRGLVDLDAATATARFLAERIRAFQQADAELARQRESDQALHDAIVAFLDECPEGRLEVLDAEISDQEAKRAAVARKQDSTQRELEDLDQADREADRIGTETSEALRAADATLAWLDELILALREEPGLRESRSAEEKRAAAAARRAEEHEGRHIAAVRDEKRYEAAANAAAEEARKLRSESARLADGEQEAVPPDEFARSDPAVPLDALRVDEARSRSALDQRAAQSVLADRVGRLTGQVADLEEEIARYPDAVRNRAQDLLATAAGQDASRRERALNGAKRAEHDLSAALGEARATVRQCREAVTAAERLRREPPRRALPGRPVTAAEADDMASAQEISAQGAGERLAEAETHIGRIDTSKAAITGRKGQFATLLDGLPTAPPDSLADEFAGDVEEARAAAREIRQRIKSAAERLTQAQGELTGAIDRLRRAGGTFTGIRGPVKDRVLNDSPEVLGPNAAGLAAQLRLRAGTLKDELAAIAKDQGILADSLSAVVRESMDTLVRAERGSRTGTAPGAWADRKVLRIAFERPDDAVLHTYAERVIERVIQKGVKPEGMPLLKEAVREAAGPRGFTVKILKPTEDTTPVTEDISRLAKWSGGEKLTVCVALYCTIVALRAARTGRGTRPGGVLLLDNPIGRASSAHLVRLQRDVAAAHGVQLIYTTGVKDPAAVIQFPNVIRMDNRQGSTQGRRYIVAGEATSEESLITGVRTAHEDRRWDDPGSAGETAL